MPIKLKGVSLPQDLDQQFGKMKVWYNSTLPPCPSAKFWTVQEFYEKFVEPLLPDTQSVIDWTKFLLDYVKNADAVFAIRAFHNWQKVKNSSKADSTLAINNGKNADEGNPYTLRRGFLTEFDNAPFEYFFSDNYLAAYFLKMAYDGFIPTQDDFMAELKNRTFPARFMRSCAEERVVAAYDITEKRAKDPGIKNLGYKIAHVVDSGKNYVSSKGNVSLGDICDNYFQRGTYNDWKKTKSRSYYVRTMPLNTNLLNGKTGLDYLKAHFLRYVCPINYFLAPKANSAGKIYQEYGSASGLITNKPDIAELSELQEYVIGRFYKLYGKVYEDYLNAIMWSSNVKSVLTIIENKLQKLGQTIIDLDVYDSQKASTSNSSKVTKPSSSSSSVAVANSTKIGQFAKNQIASKLPTMSADTLGNLQDPVCCKVTLGMNFPVLSTQRYPKGRYYAKTINGFYICNDWYERNREKLLEWLKDIH